MRIFLDTSGLIALSDLKDRNHETARAYLEDKVHKGARFVLGRNILVEYIDGVTKRIGKKKALEELDNILKQQITG
jgi:predicted nucleic acid-binding protein